MADFNGALKKHWVFGFCIIYEFTAKVGKNAISETAN